MSKHISDIKQVSRLDDLRPATEKPINKASNMIKNGSEQVSAIDTAGRTGVSAIRQARMLSESSDRQEDQEAIDKLEASARTASGDAARDCPDSNSSGSPSLSRRRSHEHNKTRQFIQNRNWLRD